MSSTELQLFEIKSLLLDLNIKIDALLGQHQVLSSNQSNTVDHDSFLNVVPNTPSLLLNLRNLRPLNVQDKTEEVIRPLRKRVTFPKSPRYPKRKREMSNLGVESINFEFGIVPDLFEPRKSKRLIQKKPIIAV